MDATDNDFLLQKKTKNSLLSLPPTGPATTKNRTKHEIVQLQDMERNVPFKYHLNYDVNVLRYTPMVYPQTNASAICYCMPSRSYRYGSEGEDLAILRSLQLLDEINLFTVQAQTNRLLRPHRAYIAII